VIVFDETLRKLLEGLTVFLLGEAAVTIPGLYPTGEI
jgi:hypothetical protein